MENNICSLSQILSTSNLKGVAVRYYSENHEESLSYELLYQKAGNLSNTIRDLGISFDSNIALYCDASIEFVVGVLG